MLIRVLHVFGKMDIGGSESRTMDLYRNINRELIQFDFLVHTNEICFFDKEIESYGGTIFRIPGFSGVNILEYRKSIYHLLEKNQFDFVHIHMTSTASMYVDIFRRKKIPVIAHATSAGSGQGLKRIGTIVLRYPLRYQADYLLACSKAAGEFQFGKRKKADIFPDAFDTVKFCFNQKVRTQVRAELQIQDKFVIGHVGRFHYAKNHEFLIEVFEEVHRKREDTVLLLVGDGELFSKIKEKVFKKNLGRAVVFLGNKENIERYYQAMDIFLFPSRYEGFPGSVIEAQLTGLKCIISSKISTEVCLTKLIRMEEIDKKENWIKETIESVEATDRTEYGQNSSLLQYDIHLVAMKLERLYFKILSSYFGGD